MKPVSLQRPSPAFKYLIYTVTGLLEMNARTEAVLIENEHFQSDLGMANHTDIRRSLVSCPSEELVSTAQRLNDVSSIMANAVCSKIRPLSMLTLYLDNVRDRTRHLRFKAKKFTT